MFCLIVDDAVIINVNETHRYVPVLCIIQSMLRTFGGSVPNDEYDICKVNHFCIAFQRRGTLPKIITGVYDIFLIDASSK